MRERYHWKKLQTLPMQRLGPRFGGTLNLEAPAPSEWSPFSDSPHGATFGHLLPLVYSQLVTTTADDYTDAHRTIIGGDLASSWELPDDQTIIFDLRNDVQWDEKSPTAARQLTAADVAFCYDTFRASEGRQAWTYRAVSRIESQESARTVTFFLNDPAAYLLNEMTSPWHVVTPPELIDDYEAVDWIQSSYGTGPFRLRLSVPGQQWSLSRNPTYFKRHGESEQRLPFLDTLNGFSFTSLTRSEHSPRETAWYNGDVDVLRTEGVDAAEEALAVHPDAVAQVTPPTPGYGVRYDFRTVTDGPFSDPRVRQALAMTIDRPALARLLFWGFAAPDCAQNWAFVEDLSTESGFREWPWEGSELGEYFQLDPWTARQLLEAAGYTEATPLGLVLDGPPELPVAADSPPTRMELVTEIMLDQISGGLGSAVSTWVAKRNLERIRHSDGSERWMSSPASDADLIYNTDRDFYSADPDLLAYGNLHSAGPWNVAGIADPELDEWAIAQARAVRPEDRSRYLEQIRKREADQAWRLHLVNPYGIVVRRGYVYNVVNTYFGKEVTALAKQFERSWRSA